MIMKDGVRIGMAVGLGYLLGRTRKGRMALMLVGVGMTGRAAKNPAALVKQGIDVLGSSPEVKTLTETVRGRLVEAGKAAAMSAVSSRVDTLTGKIEDRTGALSSTRLGGRGAPTDEDTDTDEAGDEAGDGDDGGEPDERAAERRPRRTATRRPPSQSADEPEDEPEDEDRADDRPRRPSRPSSQRPPVRRTRRREQ
jgi:hypothetical protein